MMYVVLFLLALGFSGALATPDTPPASAAPTASTSAPTDSILHFFGDALTAPVSTPSTAGQANATPPTQTPSTPSPSTPPSSAQATAGQASSVPAAAPAVPSAPPAGQANAATTAAAPAPTTPPSSAQATAGQASSVPAAAPAAPPNGHKRDRSQKDMVPAPASSTTPPTVPAATAPAATTPTPPAPATTPAVPPAGATPQTQPPSSAQATVGHASSVPAAQQPTTQQAVSRFTGTPVEHLQFQKQDQHTPAPLAATVTTRLAQEAAYLGSYIEPWTVLPAAERIEFFFDNAEITALLWYIEEKFKVNFILDDALKPLPQGSKSLLGTKISFRTHKPLTPQEAWGIFVTILDMAGMAPVPGPAERSYRIVPAGDPKSPQAATRSPIPLFVGIDPSLLPEDDTLIRYVYYVEHANLTALRAAADALRSATAPEILPFTDLNALIITDKARIVRNMLALLKELDQANVHETLRIIKLKHTDAERAAKIYEALTKREAAQGISRIIGTSKSSVLDYFSRATRMIPDARANTLIVLAPRVAMDAVEQFITTYVDLPDTRPDEPRYVYRLKYLDAKAVETILQEVLKFKADSNAAKAGGVRDGDKYFKHISAVAEPATNSLIISAEYNDYLKVLELLESIDIEQPQVALKVFLVSITLTDNKALGVQMRNKIPGPNGLLGNNVNFQTSGLAAIGPNPTTGAPGNAIVEDTNPTATGAQRLLGNLVSLASLATVGSTVVSLGSDAYGVWGMLNMLLTTTKSEIIDNPFIITTNKFPAKFTIGENRRVPSSTIFSSTTQVQAFQNLEASLQVKITPQIARDGLITLDVYVGLRQFLDPNPFSTNGDYSDQAIQTTVILGDHEALALGGLIREQVVDTTTQVPVLSDIPLIGWLFKNRTKTVTKTSLLVLILPEVIQAAPRSEELHVFTRDRFRQALDAVEELTAKNSKRDPIHNWFFSDQDKVDNIVADRFKYMSNAYIHETERTYEQTSAALQQKLPPHELTPQEALALSTSSKKAHEQIQKTLTEVYQDDLAKAELAGAANALSAKPKAGAVEQATHEFVVQEE